MPARKVKPGQPRLVHRRDIRCGREAAARRDGKGLDLAGAHVRQRIGRIVDDEIDLTGQQILHRRGGAAVRHEQKPGTRGLLEKYAADMLRTARAGCPLGRLLRVCLEPGDEAPQVIRRNGVLRDDQIRIGRDQRDRLEILQHIVRERIDRAVDHVGAPVADADRVAVGRGTRNPADPDVAVGAGHVLDDDALAERCAHVLRHGACDHVRRPARSERHDDRHRTRWVGLLRHSHRAGSQDNSDRENDFA